MKEKSRAIQVQKSIVTDLISHLAGLPEREKGPDDPISLPEIFRAKEYMAEIRGALKKGYTFEDLAEIFTERCGVAVSARQLKYHYTRGKNRGLKNQSGKKGEVIGHQKEHVSSEEVPQKDTGKSREVSVEGVKRSSKGSALVSDSHQMVKAKPGAFLIDMVQGEI
jgi:hypothetical protein